MGYVTILSGMARELKNQRVSVMMSEFALKKLGAWRRSQEELPSRGETTRRLTYLGLEAMRAPAKPITSTEADEVW